MGTLMGELLTVDNQPRRCMTQLLRQTVVGRRRTYRHRLSVGGRFGDAQILPKKGSACRNRKCPDVRRTEAEEKSSINNAAIHNEGDC